MHLTLEIISGPLKGRKIPLHGGTSLRIGRTEQAEFALRDDPEMSGVHFEIMVTQSDAHVTDLQSRNGTFVNSARITTATLKDGDVVQAGRSEFRVSIQNLTDSIVGGIDRSSFESDWADKHPDGIAAEADAITPNSSTADMEPVNTPATEMHPSRTATPAPDVPSIALTKHHGVVLEITAGPLTNKKIWLIPGQRLSLGRTAEADFVLAGDTNISAVHCEVACHGGKCIVRDLGSANGTRINGQQINEQEAQTGDVLSLGNTTIRITVGEQPATSSTLGEATTHGTVRASRPYRAAFEDTDLHVRRAALEAAVWTRQPWLLDYCRQTCRALSGDQLAVYEMLAILGEPADLPTIQRIVTAPQLGHHRLKVAGMFGHPKTLEYLLQQMEHADPRVAVGAGNAFSKILGEDFGSDQRVTLPPEDGSDPDEFEQEFLEQVKLPDPAKARKVWERERKHLEGGTRWCRGFDLSRGATDEIYAQLDQESRWEAALRGHYGGQRQSHPRDFLRFRPMYGPFAEEK